MGKVRVPAAAPRCGTQNRKTGNDLTSPPEDPIRNLQFLLGLSNRGLESPGILRITGGRFQIRYVLLPEMIEGPHGELPEVFGRHGRERRGQERFSFGHKRYFARKSTRRPAVNAFLPAFANDLKERFRKDFL